MRDRFKRGLQKDNKMTPGSRQTPLLATMLAVVFAVPATAQTAGGTGAPDRIAGYPTNAFLPGFPDDIGGLARSSIQSRPQEGRIMAIYGTPEDDRNVQVLLYALDDRGIEGNVARAQTYLEGGEIPVTRESVTSPDGTEMQCMTSRVGELGYTFCVAEIHGRALNVQIGDVVSPDATGLPAELVERARMDAGAIVDSVANAPEG